MTDENKVSARSERVIATLLPEVQPLARELMAKAAAAGIKIEIISGLRSYQEQDDLFAQGRTKPGRIVSNARGGHSNHNFGIAFDIGVFENGNYLDESPNYAKVGAMGKELGFFWGGDWKSIQDEPHFELRPEWAADLSEQDMLAQLRERRDSGQGVYA
jgi:peptidoglycan L-alanyl-D-glutamate endopeptidase CwlK